MGALLLAEFWCLLVFGELLEGQDVGEVGGGSEPPALVGGLVRRPLLDASVGIGRVVAHLAQQGVLHDEGSAVGVDAVLSATVGCGALLVADGDDSGVLRVVRGAPPEAKDDRHDDEDADTDTAG